MRVAIVLAGLSFLMVSATASQAQPQLRGRAWKMIPRTPPELDSGARDKTNITFLAMGYFLSSHWISSIVRRGNAVRFEVLTISRFADDPSPSTEWREYVGDCATLRFGVISAWGRANRRWFHQFPRDPTAEESGSESSRYGHIIRAACGRFPLEGHTTDPVRTARELLNRR